MKNKLILLLALTLFASRQTSNDSSNKIYSSIPTRSIAEIYTPVLPSPSMSSLPKTSATPSNVTKINSNIKTINKNENSSLAQKNHKESASPAKQKKSNHDLILNASIKYGASFMNLSQQGSFGKIKGSSIAINQTGLEFSAALKNLTFDFEFTHYRLDMGSDTLNTNSKENKSLNEIAFKGEYKNILLGIRSKSSPFFKSSLGSTLDWATLTSLSAIIGYHIENEWAGQSLKPYRAIFDTEASIPFSSGSDPGIDISGLSGYAIRARGRLEKKLFQGNGLNLLAGLEVIASYDHLQFNETWGGTSGSIQRNLIEMQGLFGLKMEW